MRPQAHGMPFRGRPHYSCLSTEVFLDVHFSAIEQDFHCVRVPGAMPSREDGLGSAQHIRSAPVLTVFRSRRALGLLLMRRND